MERTSTTLRRAALTAAAAAVLTCTTAPAAFADGAVLGGGCSGGWFTFTLTATGTIPAGSAWDSGYTAASNLVTSYTVSSGSPAIQVASTGSHTAHLTATSAIPAGTVVTLQPSEYPLTTKSALTLYIRGYGGSYSATFQTQDGEWPTC